MRAAQEQTYILVVEDDEPLRELLTSCFSEEGYRAVGLANGFEALSYLQQYSSPCLILLDWFMPKMGGEQFMAFQHQSATIRDIPTIVMSASPKHISDIEATGILNKPFSVDEVVELAERFCS